MKARTYFQNGSNRFEVFFVYEDCYGGDWFTSYDTMQKNGNLPNIETKYGYLVGFLRSFYYGVTERIDDLELLERPTTSQIKAFMKSCFDCVSTDETIIIHPNLLKLD